MREAERLRPGAPALVIVSDLDGTLLDAATYSASPAMRVIARLRGAGIPLVLCSSKTRAEIEVIQARLEIAHPFICENGGAVCFPHGYRADDGSISHGDGVGRIELGRPYPEIVAALRQAAKAARVRVQGYADMTVADIAADAGLPHLDAQLAKLREYDEPFRVIDADVGARERLFRALSREGVRVVQGGRYYHATGDTDKGAATAVVGALYNRRGPAQLVGLGDALNDLTLLLAVHVPIVVRGAPPPVTAELLRCVPGATVTDRPGPVGWAEAVTRVVDAWECSSASGPAC